MKVFVTGCTGWVGSRLVNELIDAGHEVSGLVRSENKAAGLTTRGVEVVLGTLADFDLLQRAAAGADAVAHLAFGQDFADFERLAAEDQQAVEAIGSALGGTDKPLLVASGVALLASDGLAVETDAPNAGSPRRTEEALRRLAGRGVRASAVRLAPTVHGVGESHGFVPLLVDLALEHGVSAYVGDGGNRWPAVHVSDAARAFRLALEAGAPEPAYHAVAEEGVAFREIAEAIGRALDLPAEPREPEHFGWFGAFAAADMPASSERTRAALGWSPSGPTLVADISDPAYHRGRR